MQSRKYHDGQKDGLSPLESIELENIHSFASLVRSMSNTAFTGRTLGQALDVAVNMWNEQDCSVILTVSGAMTVAKQGRIICDMIDKGLIQGIVTTGALIAHGLTENLGHTHYKCPSHFDDDALFKKGYNRIYDTLEMEANLDYVENFITSVLDSVEPEGGIWSSSSFCYQIGKALDEADLGTGILRSAYKKDIPVFIPAFTDSEIGLDFAIWAMKKSLQNNHKNIPTTLTPNQIFQATPQFNPFLDLQKYARMVGSLKKMGIFTIGGGVPRNWAQQISPYYDITSDRMEVDLKAPKFQYGIRICPEPTNWGGLSGCTYEEGVSWGKFISPKEGGQFAEVSADATLVLPILMKAIFEELHLSKAK